MNQKQISFAGSNGQQVITVWTPDDLATGLHPVLIFANGVGETGTTNSAGSSIGAQLKAGKSIPGASWIGIEVYKPNDGEGAFQAFRFKDTVDYVLKTYPNADPARVYVTGLSLSGGGIYALMTDGVYCQKIAAAVPVCGTQEAADQALISGVKAAALPFRAYGSSTDDNPQTRGAFTHYLAVSNITDSEKILNKYGAFIDTLTGHTGVWTKAYDFASSDLFSYLLSKTRQALAGSGTGPVITPTPIPGPTPLPVDTDPIVKVETITISTRQSGKKDLAYK